MTLPAETVTAARSAVNMFWSFRADLPDSGDIMEAIDFIRETSQAAKAAGRRITPEEWVAMAEAVDDACVHEDLPTLFGAWT